jgi:Ca-activated chloride channel family protein
MLRFLSAVILAAVSAAGSFGQAPADAATPPIVFEGEASVQLVLVPVSVARDGKPFVGLAREAFTLAVDGIRVPIELFENDARTPVSFVLLQDLSGSIANAGRIERARRAAGFFVERARGQDELAIVTFAGGRTSVDVPFTVDREAPRDAIATWEPWGTTALHDAVAWLPEIGLEGRRNRRAAILVTDGADNASNLPAEAARELVRRAQLPVYVLDLGGKRSTAPGPEGEETRRFGHVLRELAEATDGAYFPVESDQDVDRACTTIERDLANHYVLGFETGVRGFETAHSLKVTVASLPKQSPVEIEHRPTYHGRRPASMSANARPIN